MKKRGFLTLEPIPGNKKEKAIVLTEQGRAFVHEHLEITARPTINALMRMPAAELEMMMQLMHKHLSILREEFSLVIPDIHV